MVGDELVAVAGWRLLRSEDLAPVLAAQRSLDALEVHFARDGRLRRTALHPTAPRVERWTLESAVAVSPEALEQRRRWLSLEAA